MAQKKPSNQTMIVVLVLLLLTGAGFAIWWFMFREKPTEGAAAPSVQAPGVSEDTLKQAFIGKLYGNADLSTMYHVVDRSVVKVLKVGDACKNVSWSVSGSTVTVGDEKFTVGPDSLTSSTETFDEMEGPIADYCALVGTSM